MYDKNGVADCLSFFEKAVPAPTPLNFGAQLGCHFEEVKEMLDELKPLDQTALDLISQAKAANHALAEYLKSGEGRVKIRSDRRVAYLDSICDQLVTAIGCAHMAEMDVEGGFNEVNRSNLSKFDEDGNPIFAKGGKILRGPNYSPANLEPFV